MSSTRRPRSPAATGITIGLVLALAAALSVLVANQSWLLPSLDDEGVTAIVGGAALAQGQSPTVRVADFDAPFAWRAVAPGHAILPVGIGWLGRHGVRSHIAGLWVMAGGLALTVLGVSWLAGGAAGLGGALVAVALLIVSPVTAEVVTTLDMTSATMAGMALLAGALVYRPGGSLLHGVIAAACWALSPVGAGGALAAAAWPWVRPGPGRPAQSAAAAAPSLALPALGAIIPGVPALAIQPGGASAEALSGFARWAGAGMDGSAGVAIALLVGVATAALLAHDRRMTELPPPDTLWHDPAARDVLAVHAWRVLPLVAACVGLSAFLFGSSERSGLVAAPPVAALLGLLIARAFVRSDAPRRVALTLGALTWLTASGWAGRARLVAIQTEGADHTARVWVDSPVIRFLDNQVPGGAAIYADQPLLVLLQTGRPVLDLEGALPRLDDLATALLRTPGVLALTGADREAWRLLAPSLGLTPVVDAEEGMVLAPSAWEAGER